MKVRNRKQHLCCSSASSSVINAKKRKPNPLKVDPTRTATLRRQFAQRIKQVFARLRFELVKLIVDEDAFGLKPVEHFVTSAESYFASCSRDDKRKRVSLRRAVVNAGRWQFRSDPEKVKAFQAWLKSQVSERIRSQTEEQLWRQYVEEGFRKGAGRAFDDVKTSELRRRRPELFTPEAQGQLRDFYAGTKDQFLRSSFAQPVSVEKVKLLAGRTWDDLEGITVEMGTRMSRTLTDGLVEGKSPREIARDLADEVDVSAGRAQVIARTEIIRAHAEGQLQALEELGVEEVGVAVEWSTTGDDKVCPLCQPLEGVVLKLDEARNLLPRHPNAVFAGSTFTPYGQCLELVRAKYSGPCVVLHTTGAGKNRTTIGPNHPMMSRRGVVKAAELCEGDEVLYDLRGDGFADRVFEVNHEQVPAIENVCEAVFSVCKDSTVASPGSDLHGDRMFCKGEVQGVRPAWGLLKGLDPCGIQHLLENDFMGSDVRLDRVPSSRASFLGSKIVGLAPSRRVRSRSLVASLGGGHSGPLEKFGLTLGSELDTESCQTEMDRLGRHSERIRDALGRFPIQVSLPNFFVWKRVHKVSSGWFDGWAFDASTYYSLYCSDGFVVKNCRCAFVPANVGESEAGQKDTQRSIKAAIAESVEEEGGEEATSWPGSDRSISKGRPEPIVHEALDEFSRFLANAFCPTGEGGGVDPKEVN